MIIVGLVLAPVFIFILIKELWDYKTSKESKRKWILFMLMMSVAYVYFCFKIPTEPFVFIEDNAADYIVDFAIIFVFSPALWVDLFAIVHYFYKKGNIIKNSRIWSKDAYVNCKTNLDMISPGVLMFTHKMDIDVKTAIAASVMKLKLDGFIKENKKSLAVTDKDQSSLSESDKEILKLVAKEYFDEAMYRHLVEEEAISQGLIKHNLGNLFLKIIKVIFLMAMPGVLFYLSYNFDQYVLHEYHKTNQVLNVLVAFSIIIVIISVLINIYLLVEEFRYIDRHFKRTPKGTELVNRAYALKNYLKLNTNTKKKSGKKIKEWEYYLVYAVVLDVNKQIPDEMLDMLKLSKEDF